MLCNLDQIRLSGIARNVGLSELLTTQDPIRGHVLETQHPNLSLLPSGLLPPNPADLLSTQRMHKILVEAEQALHLVIIDGPPTLVLADSPLLAALSVTAFSLSRPVRRARRRRSAQPTGSDGDHILGAALTKASREAGYGYSRYGYGYGHPKVDKKRTEILMIPQGTEH